MNLFDYAEVKNISLIDVIKSYIEKNYIRKVVLENDYEGEIEDMYKIYPFFKECKTTHQFALRGYITKSNNYITYAVLKRSGNLDDFIDKLKKEAVTKLGAEKGMWLVNRCAFLIKANNISSLKDFERNFVETPLKLSLIRAESIEKIALIKKDILEFQKLINNHPHLLEKRDVKKILGIGRKRKSDDEVGNGLESFLGKRKNDDE